MSQGRNIVGGLFSGLLNSTSSFFFSRFIILLEVGDSGVISPNRGSTFPRLGVFMSPSVMGGLESEYCWGFG